MESGAYSNQTKEPPPHNIQLVVGYVHGAFSRAFVEYVLHDPIARDLVDWSKNTRVPDEVVFSTLNHMNHHLKVPGSFTGKRLFALNLL